MDGLGNINPNRRSEKRQNTDETPKKEGLRGNTFPKGKKPPLVPPRSLKGRASLAAENEMVGRVSKQALSTDKTAALSFPEGLDVYRKKKAEPGYHTWLCQHSVYDPEDPERAVALQKVTERTYETPAEDRAFGALLGLVVGDALGAPFEFSPYTPGKPNAFNGFQDEDEWQTVRRDHNRFKLKPGQWTDDTSMALCLADSLLEKKGIDPLDLRMKFLAWSAYGYNNSFGFDPEIANGRPSVGLGGTIQLSLQELALKGINTAPYTEMGNKTSSGNGSIMRLAPVSLYYSNNPEKAMEAAYLQSKTTHQGEEAAECARLLAFATVRAIHANFSNDFSIQDRVDSLIKGFTTASDSVRSLAKSEREDDSYSKARSLNPEDRNWNWKDPNFTFADSRVKTNSGYAGSYSMDCLSMALHCVYYTNSFEEAVLKAASQGGDADTVAAVTAQIAGSIYGASSIPKEWLSATLKWDGNNDIPLRAHKLFHRV